MSITKRAFYQFLSQVLIVCLVFGLTQGFTFGTIKAGATVVQVTQTTPTTVTTPTAILTKTTPTSLTITKIKIKKKPTKLSYLQGESLIKTGLKIKIIYSDLSTKIISTGYKLSGNNFTSNKTSQKVTVKYGGKSTSFTVTVSPITKIKILKKPTKLRYYQGEGLSTKGMTVVATYSNMKTKTIAVSKCKVTGYSSSKGSKVTVTYLGKKTTFKTSLISKIKSITIKAPTKTTKKGNKSFTTTGMKITVKYNNKKVRVVKVSSGKVTGYNKNKKGKQTLKFTYGGKTKKFKIKVK